MRVKQFNSIINACKKNINIRLIISVFLLLIVVYYVIYVVNKEYNKEGYDTNNPTYTHRVDLPINSVYTCKNMCGNSRCYITGHQCTSDIDCPGCDPDEPPRKNKQTKEVPGNNESGKLTFSQAPRYSELTSDIGTTSAIINNNKFGKVAQANFGSDTWSSQSNQDREMHDSKYNKNSKKGNLKFTPNYPPRYSVLGDYIDDGPLASNAYLS